MALGDNSMLITTANIINVMADGGVPTNYNGVANQADTFVIADGAVGDDAFNNFGKNDSLITHHKIFDGNSDGYIDFGPNGQLDVNRTGAHHPGDDQITIGGEGGGAVTNLRYLGTKGDGNFVYADSSVRTSLFADSSTGGMIHVEGTVANDTLNAGLGATVFLYDNALGLNLGGDTINGFGKDDLIVTTAKLYDSNSSNIVTFGGNGVLDLSSQTPAASDPTLHPGGEIDLNTPDHQSVAYLGEKTIGGVEYFFYGLDAAAHPAGVTLT